MIVWLFVELYRLNKGFEANINESFPDILNFSIITVIFGVPPQVLFILGKEIIPVEKSVFILYIIFVIFELIVSIFVMKNVLTRKSSLYILYNSATEKVSNYNTKTKSSELIKEEVDYMLQNSSMNRIN